MKKIMLWKMKYFRQSLCFLLALIMGLCMAALPQSVAAAVPGLDAKVTKKNIMKVIKSCDSDGAYILRTATKRGDNICTWWGSGETITQGLSTAVHEECHGYIHGFGTLNIYTGKKKQIKVPETEVFRTKKIAKSIPKKLRTSRYELYVANKEKTKYLSSDVDGVYGLMNEFTAYYWGMHTTVALYDYYKKQGNTLEIWQSYMYDVAGGDERLSYPEFKYFILTYLIYAKKHYPQIYKKIIANKKFAKAYVTIDKKFAKLQKQYIKNLNEICNNLRKQGYECGIDGDYFSIEGRGIGIAQSDYEKFQKVLKKSKYTKMQKKLVKKAK